LTDQYLSILFAKLVLSLGLARLSAIAQENSPRFWTIVDRYYDLVGVLGYFG